MDRKITVSDEQDLAFRRQLDDLHNRVVVHGSVPYAFAVERVRAIAMGTDAAVADPHAKKLDLASSRLAEVEAYYHSHGFMNLGIPKPNVSNREYRRRLKLGQELFFRPASHLVSYDGFMQAVGQANHWTVTDQAERAKIGWNPTATGYWFWAEVASPCPRLGTSRNDLMKKIHLLSLEEYVIVWHLTKTIKNVILDPDSITWTWLRTSYDGSGALDAGGHDGRVGVDGYGAVFMALACGFGGGRLAEVVKD